jgi:hypothetical protein
VVECCKLIAEITQKNYDEGRWIRMVGESGVIGVQQITQDLKNVNYDISMVPGTTLPFDEEKRAAKYLQAYELLNNPMPNPLLPEVLRVLEIYNWQKILSQHAGWIQFTQFSQLLEGLKTGQVDPQQAMAMLGQKVMEASVQGAGARENAGNSQTATR